MRSALKLGTKIPPTVLSSTAYNVQQGSPAAERGLPSVPELKPHWQIPGLCRSILLESITACRNLLLVC